jgi:hypothetical protein
MTRAMAAEQTFDRQQQRRKRNDEINGWPGGPPASREWMQAHYPAQAAA